MRSARAALLALSLLAALPAARAAEGPRIASINLCADQLLLAVADPGQILGLSPFVRDPRMSYYAERAEGLPVLSGGAEEALRLAPDVVLAGRFTARATRELLRAKGLRVEEIDPAQSIAEARAQILRMGVIAGRPERARALAEELDAALARADAAARSRERRPRVLALARRGWVAGGESLMSDLLAAAGLDDASDEMGLPHGGLASLEAVLALAPDALVVSRAQAQAEDQGTAFLRHPALEALFPPERRIVVPERATVCGGPMIADALEILARAEPPPRAQAARRSASEGAGSGASEMSRAPR